MIKLKFSYKANFAKILFFSESPAQKTEVRKIVGEIFIVKIMI
jgi:hypothetical protein